MTLKQKFTWLSALAVALVALAGIQNARALETLVAAAERQENAARIIHAHMHADMHADMMHDALHTDVLKALYGHGNNDAALVATAAAEARTDGAALAEDIAVAISHNPPGDIEAALRAAREMVTGYTQAAAAIIGSAREGGDRRKTEKLLPAFEAAFGDLKDKNDKISAQLGGWLHSIEEQQDALARETQRWNTLTAFLIVLITMGIPVFARRQVFMPLEKLIDTMKDLSGGRLDDAVTGTERADEVGDISRALAVFRENAQAKRRLEAETAVLEQEAAALGLEAAQLKKQAEEDRRRALFGLADNFEANVKSVADTVATAATEMDATSRDVMQRTHDSADKLGLLVSGIAGASQNVQTVAAAAELSASIREIAAQVGHGGKIMHAAVAEAGRANEKAESLSRAAERIGSVVDVINDITEQINLLALNATIEAARARGRAGQGLCRCGFRSQKPRGADDSGDTADRRPDKFHPRGGGRYRRAHAAGDGHDCRDEQNFRLPRGDGRGTGHGDAGNRAQRAAGGGDNQNRFDQRDRCAPERRRHQLRLQPDDCGGLRPVAPVRIPARAGGRVPERYKSGINLTFDVEPRN